jgi:hypothetical protein
VALEGAAKIIRVLEKRKIVSKIAKLVNAIKGVVVKRVLLKSAITLVEHRNRFHLLQLCLILSLKMICLPGFSRTLHNFQLMTCDGGGVTPSCKP